MTDTPEKQSNPFEFIRVRSDQWDGLQADLRAKDTLITQLQGEVERLNKECQHYASNPCGDRNHIGLTHVLCNLPGGRLPNPQLGQDSAMAAHIIGSLESEVTRLTSLLEKAKHYLERLARLGNEPHLGNSRGNELAQEALRLLEGKQ